MTNSFRWWQIRNNLCYEHALKFLNECKFDTIGTKIHISKSEDCNDCTVEKERLKEKESR